MRIDELTTDINGISVDPLKDQQMSSRQFSQIISTLKKQELDNKDAVAASRMVMNMWNAGDKLLKDYKKLLKGYNINIQNVLDN